MRDFLAEMGEARKKLADTEAARRPNGYPTRADEPTNIVDPEGEDAEIHEAPRQLAKPVQPEREIETFLDRLHRKKRCKPTIMDKGGWF